MITHGLREERKDMGKVDNLKWLEWAEDECAPLLGGEAMNTEIEDFEIEDLAAAYSYLDYAEKEIDKRKKAMRERLLDEADKQGSATEKGGSILFTDAAKVIKERRVAKLPAESTLLALVQDKGLDPMVVFTVVENTIIDPSKLELAIDTGKLDFDDVEALRKVSYALKVVPSNELERLMMEAREPYEITPLQPLQEEIAAKPKAKKHAAIRNKAAAALKAAKKAQKGAKIPASLSKVKKATTKKATTKKAAAKKTTKKAAKKKSPAKKRPSARRGS